MAVIWKASALAPVEIEHWASESMAQNRRHKIEGTKFGHN